MPKSSDHVDLIIKEQLDLFHKASIPGSIVDQCQTQFAKLLYEPNLMHLSRLISAPTAPAKKLDFSAAKIVIGDRNEIDLSTYESILKSLQDISPWKKGPFSIFGIEINSEWRSDLKWDRLKDNIAPLRNRVVADVGCHNGYFMFRMLAENPKLVVGIEPVLKHWATFQLLQKYIRSEKLMFEPIGVDSINEHYEFFDTVFLLGILYHHTDPVGILRKVNLSLKKDGEVVIDCQGIPGSESLALTPKGRYAGASGIWFLPTKSCLENWITRAGFRKVETFYCEPLSCEEQRTTEWAPIKSLKDFLSADQLKTIEGYPAPLRIYCKAIK